MRIVTVKNLWGFFDLNNNNDHTMANQFLNLVKKNLMIEVQK